MSSMRAVVGWGLGLLLWVAPVTAQCPAPDKLDGGPCCAQTQPFFPGAKAFQQTALDICWQGCNVSSVSTCVANWGGIRIPAPNPGTVGPCGPISTQLRLSNTAGILKWSGKLSLLYSRTWIEIDPAGNPLQVWRYLVNGDLSPTAAAGPIPCPIPPCAPATNNRVRFTGYVDYARTCGTTTFQYAWMLTHACDLFDHAPGFPRAGAFHPDRSYTFVGPAAGFVPAAVTPAEGGRGATEAIRRLRYIPGTTLPNCEFEDPALHLLTPTTQTCVCGLPAQPPQFLLGTLTATTACGHTLTTPGGPFLPGFLSMGIGSWTIPGTYPGVEVLRWNAGNYNFTDACTGILQNEPYFGVTTLQGYPAIQLLSSGPGGPLPPIFIDQANSLRAPFGGPVMNVPFISDHILNLNH